MIEALQAVTMAMMVIVRSVGMGRMTVVIIAVVMISVVMTIAGAMSYPSFWEHHYRKKNGRTGDGGLQVFVRLALVLFR